MAGHGELPPGLGELQAGNKPPCNFPDGNNEGGDGFLSTQNPTGNLGCHVLARWLPLEESVE